VSTADDHRRGRQLRVTPREPLSGVSHAQAMDDPTHLGAIDVKCLAASPYRQYGNTVSTVMAPPPSRRRRTRTQARAENRSALLAAARELIVEVGYTGAQLDEIATRAGLTKGAIYSIFGGKLELFRAVVDEHAREVYPLLDLDVDTAGTMSAEELVVRLVRRYLAVLDQPNAQQLLRFELDLANLALRDAATLQLVVAHERRIAERLTAALTGRRRRRGSPLSATQAAVVADLVLGALGGLGQRLVLSPWMSRDPDEIATALVRLLPSP